MKINKPICSRQYSSLINFIRYEINDITFNTNPKKINNRYHVDITLSPKCSNVLNKWMRDDYIIDSFKILSEKDIRSQIIETLKNYELYF